MTLPPASVGAGETPASLHLRVELARNTSAYPLESHFPASVIKMLSSLRMFSQQSNFVFYQPELNTRAPKQPLQLFSMQRFSKGASSLIETRAGHPDTQPGRD